MITYNVLYYVVKKSLSAQIAQMRRSKCTGGLGLGRSRLGENLALDRDDY